MKARPLKLAQNRSAEVELSHHRVTIDRLRFGILPGKIQKVIGLDVDLIRDAERAARDPPKIVTHTNKRDHQDPTQRSHDAGELKPEGRAFFLQHPKKQSGTDRNKEEQALVRPG